MSSFNWTKARSEAAVLLANGYTQNQVGKEVGVSARSIRKWLAEPEFMTEVDRLSHMVSVASRAERLRMAMRVVRTKVNRQGVPRSNKDLLDWLKFLQSETDGVKLDMMGLFEAASRDE